MADYIEANEANGHKYGVDNEVLVTLTLIGYRLLSCIQSRAEEGLSRILPFSLSVTLRSCMYK